VIKMEAYTSLANLYDVFMDNIPYKEWGEYLSLLLTEYGVKDGLVLDIGCGTGNITQLLADKGYDMIGIDNSPEMLNIAIEKRDLTNKDILYLNQDMRSFELYGTVGAVISICDSINYLLEYNELVETFKLVNNYLDPGGIFIFDLVTRKKFVNIEGTIAENRDEGSFIWENTFYEDEMINEFEMTIFKKNEDDLYEKTNEIHYQKIFSIKEIKMALKEAGLVFVDAYDAFTKKKPKRNSDRIYIIAREAGK